MSGAGAGVDNVYAVTLYGEHPISGYALTTTYDQEAPSGEEAERAAMLQARRDHPELFFTVRHCRWLCNGATGGAS